MAKILGLTLWRPWDWAFLHGKDFENRLWVPSIFTLSKGDFVALHAGQRWEEEAVEFIEDITGLTVPEQADWPAGRIIAVARYQGWTRESNSRWFCGPFGWRFDQVTKIEPVPCKGAQKLWALPPAVLAQVRYNYTLARQQQRAA